MARKTKFYIIVAVYSPCVPLALGTVSKEAPNTSIGLFFDFGLFLDLLPLLLLALIFLSLAVVGEGDEAELDAAEEKAESFEDNLKKQRIFMGFGLIERSVSSI